MNTHNLEVFGQTPDNKPVYRMHLQGGGLQAYVLSWGAILQDLRFAPHPFPLVLGFDHFTPYLHHSPYFGTTVGRYANRLAAGRFVIDGTSYQTDQNEGGRHCLHGGKQGFSNRNWQIADYGPSHARLTLTDEEGTMGFPGRCAVSCDYQLKDDGILHIAYTSQTNAPSPVNLAHHSYFNLAGNRDCLAHELQINANHYLPVDANLIPTGDIAPVDHTPFDFRQLKPIGQDLNLNENQDSKTANPYDHNFCLSNERQELRPIAFVRDPSSKLSMRLSSTEPGVQFYCGHKINTPVAGLTRTPYRPYDGFCLETQNWPDAPNQKHFPNAILRPQETLHQVSLYQFKQEKV